MTTLKYQIDFFSDWHCGSGLSSGADIDVLVIKDNNNLPFIPGKTIKGLVREAAEEIQRLSGKKDEEMIKQIFGYFEKDVSEKEIEAVKGECFFTNAILDENLANGVLENDMMKFFYRTISSTQIDAEGVAEKHSLRKMQVTIPCTLKGEILDVPKKFESDIEIALQFVKRLGQNRNRGLGRCTIRVIKETKKEDTL